MFLRELIASDDEKRAYEQILVQLSSHVHDAAQRLVCLQKLVEEKTISEHKVHHATILVLIRHLISQIDSVSILVEKGAAENCGQLLRSRV